MKNKMKIKKLVSIITAAILLALAALLVSCGNKLGVEGPNEGPIEDVKRTYWSIDSLRFDSDEIYLTKTVVDGNGNILTIENYNLNTREDFYYKDGKLEYSETFETYDLTKINGTYQYAEEKVYETRYVYEGDRIVRGEIFYNGVPTRSYDEYEYSESGELKSLKRHNYNSDDETYIYSDGRIVSQEGKYRKYVFEYDEAGNLKKCTEFKTDGTEMGYIQIQYSDGVPVGATRNSESEQIETTYKYHENGNFSEVACSYKKLSDGKVKSEKTSLTEYNEKGMITAVYGDLEKSSLSVEASYEEEGLVEVKYYNKSGQMLTARVEYGENGVAKSKKYYSDTSTEAYSVFEFNENGKVEKQAEYYEDGTVAIEFVYEYYPSGIRKKKTATEFGYTWVRAYAENGNATKTESADGSYIEYINSEFAYNFTRNSSVWDLTTDTLGWLTSRAVVDGRVIEEYAYFDNYVKKTKTTYNADGSYSVLEYDDLGRKTKTTEYDAAGNVVKETVYDK